MNYQASQRAIEAGLILMIDDEPYITDVGLLSICCSLATSDEVDEEDRRFNSFAYGRVLRAARAAGFEDKDEIIMLELLANDVDPAGESDASRLLATIFKFVSLLVGDGRMKDLIEGNKPH